MPNHNWLKYSVLLLAISIIITAAIVFDSVYSSQFATALKLQFNNSLEQKYASLSSWAGELQSEASYLANSKTIISIVHDLSVTANKDKPTTQKILTDWLDRVRKDTPFEDFLLLDQQGSIVVNGNYNKPVTHTHLDLPNSFVQRIWQGHSAISLPITIDYPLKDQSGRTKSGLTSVFVAAPVFDITEQQVTMALLLRLDPSHFSSLFFQPQPNTSQFESYAFSRDGKLLSESQHDDQMRKHGVLTENNSLGNITVALPGFNMDAGEPEQTEPVEQAKTHFEISPYLNYRGKRVIGAWHWYPADNLGIALELDADQAIQPLSTMRYAVLAISFLLLLTVAGIFFLFDSIFKYRLKQAYIPSLLEAGSEAILSTDRNGTILYANNRVSDILGYTTDELLKKNIDMLLPEALRGLHQHHRQEFMKNPQQRPMGRGLELHAQHKNGDVVLIEVSLNPFQHNQVSGVTVSLRDVSVQQQLQYEISHYRGRLNQLVEKRTAELEASRKELESYSYTIAHDLRTPLRAIAGYAQLLQAEDELEKPGEREDALKRIVLASKRMADMIDDILELSRITRNDINYDSVNLSLLVEKSIEGIKQKCPQQKFRFKVAKDLRVNGDRRLLSLVVDNLIENACKYTRLRPISIVEFGVHTHNEVDAYFIRDNGIGFDMAYRNQLFKPFYRLHAPELYEGEGIGLATAQRIIHRHGGRIWANSEKNVGSTFYFTIPNARSPDNKVRAINEKNQLSVASSQETPV